MNEEYRPQQQRIIPSTVYSEDKTNQGYDTDGERGPFFDAVQMKWVISLMRRHKQPAVQEQQIAQQQLEEEESLEEMVVEEAQEQQQQQHQ